MSRKLLASQRPTRQLVSTVDAAEYLGCTPRTVRRRIADGSLTAYRMGPRLVRVDLTELDNLLRPIPNARTAGASA